MERKIRVPQQKRSIAKKRHIIDAAQLVFNRNGYFGTSMAEIAKEADLSVGSVYSYFEDKKDILLACLSKFGDALTDEICREINTFSGDGDLISTAKRSVEALMKSEQGQTKLYHDEIESLRYRDKDVYKHFENVHRSLMTAITNAIHAHGYFFPHDREQTFLLFHLVEATEDELTFGCASDVDHDILLNECAQLIISMVRKKEE